MAWLNGLFNLAFVAFLVRAIVPNKGHMAFNRPYQFIVRRLDPLQTKFLRDQRRIGSFCLLAIIALVLLRGVLWTLCSPPILDFRLLMITRPYAYLSDCVAYSFLSAAIFFLQFYAFLAFSFAIGKLDHKTDHYSRLLRALWGPLKLMSPWSRCIVTMLAMILFWIITLWILMVFGTIPPESLYRSIPIAMALITDLIFVWIFLLIAKIIFSWIPIWRPPIAEWIEHLTDPVAKPFERFKLKWNRLDLTPFVSILALVFLQWLILDLLERIYSKL